MNGLFLNADSLTNKLQEFNLIVREHEPHIIGINEVLPKNYKRKVYKEEFALAGYEMITHSNVDDNIGRGSIIFIKNGISYKQIYIDINGSHFDESLFIEIPLNDKDKLLCACFYRRGQTSSENNNLLLETFLEISKMGYTHVLLMGDFNLTNIDWVDNRCTTGNTQDINFRFMECMRDSFFFQHVNEPTRQRGSDDPSTLDLLITNEENMIKSIQYLAPLGKSDHSILKFELFCSLEKQPPKIKVCYNKGNYAKFKGLLQDVDWQNEMSPHIKDVDKLWDIFKFHYCEAESKCVPNKVVYVNGKKSKRLSLPLDRKILKKIKKKNKLWSKKRMDLAREEEKLQYNRIRNQVRKLTRKAKKVMEKKIAKSVKENPKNFWSYAQSKLKSRAGIPELEKMTDDGSIEYAKEDDDKAEVFVKYFSSVFTSETDEDMPYFEERIYNEVLSNITINQSDILKKLKKIKVNKSPGPDNIHPRVLHEISSEICEPLEYIFQSSINTQKLPAEWKHAKVTAIYKKGAKTKPQNYRPVSLTCIICKILESILRDHVTDHMKINKLFSDKQFGFITGRSTTLQLLHVLDIWTQILDEGGSLDAIYCDFMKAFDKVPHKRLIHKISKYGIKGNVLGWINSFLSDRTQLVSVGKSESERSKVTSGIPQGSVLGPLLFVIYINDLPEIVDNGSFVYLFADDTKVFRQIRTTADNEILQKDITNLIRWSDTWLLRFHPDKCVTMTIQNHPITNPHEYFMGDIKLSNSQCEKDIGVYIDNNLKFDIHINNAVNKANKILAVTRKTFECMDKEIFCLIFKGLVRPHLEYAAPVWSPHLVKHKDLLENVQRRATKMIPGLSHLSYSDRLKHLELPTLAYRRARGDMIQVFKLTHEEIGYDKSLPPIFIRSSNNLRGHTKKLFMTSAHRDIRKHSFSHRVINAWNALPNHVVSAKTVKEFEKGLDEFWSHQEIKYDNHLANITV